MGGGESSGASPHDNGVNGQVRHGCSCGGTLMRIPGVTRVWQASWYGTSSMVTRHSAQMPMPHSGARGWPVTDIRVFMKPACAKAPATVLWGVQINGWLLMVIVVMRAPHNALVGRGWGQYWASYAPDGH